MKKLFTEGQIFNNFLVLIPVGGICVPVRENVVVLQGKGLD
jgi:hypothetical protein